jgi:Uma2 family endonuclease
MRRFKGDPVVIPADWIPGPEQGEWTYEDYAAIPEDGHCYDVVEGVLYMLPPRSPSHQETVVAFTTCLHEYVKTAKLGEVYVGPLDVELNQRNIVQPDVLVVLNERLDRITETHIVGAPDLVIEITASNTDNHDYGEKWEAYASAGVPEYWVVTAEELTIELLILDGSEYRSLGLFIGPAKLPSQVLPNLPVSVEQLCTGTEASRQSTQKRKWTSRT